MAQEGKKRFGFWRILAIVVVLLILAVVALPFLLDANQFRPKLESEIGGAIGREVKIGDLKLSLFSGGVAADDISIADDPAFSRSPFVHAKSLRVGVELSPLIFSKSLRITGISLVQPEINLIRSNEGVWNFAQIGPKTGRAPGNDSTPRAGTETAVSIAELKVTDGRISMIHAGKRAKPHVYDKVNLTARDLSFDSTFPFNLSATLPGGGGVKVDGKAGPINRTDAALTPMSVNMTVTRLDLLASGFIEPDAGLAGVIDFNGSADSDGKELLTKGSAKAEKLQIVKGGSPASLPLSLSYRLNHHLKSETGTITDTSATFGKAVAHLSGTYDMRGDSTAVKLKLRGDNMPADDLEALLPAIGVIMPKGAALQGGTLNADLSAEGPVENIVTTGTIGLLGTRLSGFDLGSKIAAVTSLAGIKANSITEIEKFASDLRVAPSGIQVNALTLIVPALGTLTGTGTVAPNSALDFTMLAKLNASGGVLGGISRLAGGGAGGNLDVPFFIRGTSSNPSFVPDTKGAAKSLLNKAISGKSGDGSTGQKLQDTLKGLFGKKKP